MQSAKVMDYEGIKTLLRRADKRFPRLRHLWLDAGYRGEDKGAGTGYREDPGLERGSRGAPAQACPRRGADGMGQGVGQKEGVAVDWQKLMSPKGFVVLPRRWVVERTIAWIDQNRRMSLGITRGCVRAGRRWCTLP